MSRFGFVMERSYHGWDVDSLRLRTGDYDAQIAYFAPFSGKWEFYIELVMSTADEEFASLLEDLTVWLTESPEPQARHCLEALIRKYL